MQQQVFVGRRKTSTARLYIQPGKGGFVVNGEPVEQYLITKANANVAIQLALARAIDSLNEGVHSTLKKKELLTRDDRMVERKKYGRPKARKRFQFSKR